MPKLDLSTVPVKTGSIYPEPYAAMMRGRSSLRLGEAGGLGQYGEIATYSDVDMKVTMEAGKASFTHKDGSTWKGPR
jgi:uncharacterized cupin superfamily protein